MKLIKSLIVCCFFLAISTPANAQLWKKLKKKVQQKIEKKVEKEADKLIDSTLDGKKKKTKNTTPTQNKDKDYGDATINHSHTYNQIKIKHLTQTKVNKQGNQFTINGYWWSSGVDVYDGYKVTIKNTSKEELMGGKTFQIPNEASLYIGYDPLLGDRENRKEKWKGSVKNEIENGTVKVQYVEGQSVHVSFIANGTLQKYIDTGGDNGYYDKKPIAIEGKLTTENPSFTITKEVKKEAKNTSNTELTNSDKAYIKEKISPTVNIPSAFSFNKSIELEFTDDRGDSYPMEFLLGNYPDIWGMSVAAKEMGGQGKVIMVMTPKSSTAFMDVAGMKMKKSTSLQQMGDQYDMTSKLPDDGDFEYKKTGNTKTILGYSCEEYRVDYNYTNDKGSAIFWVAKDFPIQNKELPMLGMKLNNPYFNGFVLEFNTISQGKKYTIKVTNVSDKNVSINTSEYRNMGF